MLPQVVLNPTHPTWHAGVSRRGWHERFTVGNRKLSEDKQQPGSQVTRIARNLALFLAIDPSARWASASLVVSRAMRKGSVSS